MHRSGWWPVTPICAGFDGLALPVQETLKRDPHSGHLFVFRPAGGLRKICGMNSQGLCLYAKRLESGRLIWPSRPMGCVRWRGWPRAWGRFSCLVARDFVSFGWDLLVVGVFEIVHCTPRLVGECCTTPLELTQHGFAALVRAPSCPDTWCCSREATIMVGQLHIDGQRRHISLIIASRVTLSLNSSSKYAMVETRPSFSDVCGDHPSNALPWKFRDVVASGRPAAAGGEQRANATRITRSPVPPVAKS